MEDLPAWSLPADAAQQISIGEEWPERVTRDWAWGGSTGKGVSVCILDSGVEPAHPLVGDLDGAVAVARVSGLDAAVQDADADALAGRPAPQIGRAHV